MESAFLYAYASVKSSRQAYVTALSHFFTGALLSFCFSYANGHQARLVKSEKPTPNPTLLL